MSAIHAGSYFTYDGYLYEKTYTATFSTLHPAPPYPPPQKYLRCFTDVELAERADTVLNIGLIIIARSAIQLWHLSCEAATSSCQLQTAGKFPLGDASLIEDGSLGN